MAIVHILSIIVRNRLCYFLFQENGLPLNSKMAKGIRWLVAVPVYLLPLAFLDFSGNYLDAYPAFVSQTIAGLDCV